MPKCILTGVELTSINDSDAHIIPSAMGGRLKPKGVLSQLANNDLDRKFDNELIRAFQPFMTLVNGSRDRGGAPVAVLAKAKDATQYKIGPDGIEATKPEYIKSKTADGHEQVTIMARTMKELDTMLGRAKKDFGLSDAEIEKFKASATVQQVDVGALDLSIQIGPISTFPAVFVMASVFAASNNLPVHPKFVEFVDNFDQARRTLPPNTFYFVPEDPWFELIADVSHGIVLYCDQIRKQAIFFAQLFNQPGIAVLMPYEGNVGACFTYGVDVLTGMPIPVFVNEETLCCLDWAETHTLGPDLWKIVEERGRPLIELAHKIDYENSYNKIIDSHAAGRTLDQLSPEEMTALQVDLETFKKRVKERFTPTSS